MRDEEGRSLEIATLEKRAGEGGNRHGCGLDATVKN